MTVTVIDGNDLPAILADAGVTLDPPAGAGAAGAGAASSGEGAGAAAEGGKQQGADQGEQGASENTGAAAHAAEDTDDVEGEDGLTPRQKRELTEKMQKAVGKKHRALREAEEFAAAQYNTAQLAQRRAQELEAELTRMRGAAPQRAEAQKAAKPDRKDFANESDFLDAMIDFGVSQKLAAQREQEAKEAAERAHAAMIESARARVQRAAELVPDYLEVVGASDMEVPPSVAGYMQKSEMLAELGYHLAKNPEVLVSLTKLAPDEQLVKIGKIESTLQPFGSTTSVQHDTTSSQQQPNGKPAAPAPSEITGAAPSKARGNAAPVITPLEGTGSAGTQKDPADMNIRETIQDWSRRNKSNLGARKRH